jgi:hypothetical protein
MSPQTKKHLRSAEMQRRLEALEAKASDRGLRVHYDRLEAAGLKLRGGLCKIRGEYHIFVEKRKSIAQKIEMLQDLLAKPLPLNVPELSDKKITPVLGHASPRSMNSKQSKL